MLGFGWYFGVFRPETAENLSFLLCCIHTHHFKITHFLIKHKTQNTMNIVTKTDMKNQTCRNENDTAGFHYNQSNDIVGFHYNQLWKCFPSPNKMESYKPLFKRVWHKAWFDSWKHVINNSLFELPRIQIIRHLRDVKWPILRHCCCIGLETFLLSHLHVAGKV